MKTRVYVIAVLAICMTLLIIGANSNLAWAQASNSCTASLNYPPTPQYSSPNSPFVVPVSASCASYYGSQLYASGTAYDVTSNSALGSANSVLTAVNGGPQYNGELAFSTPPTSPSDSVQISVSVYDSPGGNLLTSTTETVPAGTGVQQPAPLQTIQAVTTTTVTENQPAYANPYPYPYQPSSPPNYQPSPQGQDSTQYWFAYSQRANDRRLFEYIVITVIVGAVIITVVGLLLIARRQQRPQPVWYPAYPAPPPPAPPR